MERGPGQPGAGLNTATPRSGAPASPPWPGCESWLHCKRWCEILLAQFTAVLRVAFDFDTFLFEDPRNHLEAAAEAAQADVLVARHLDADCLNMGRFLSVQALNPPLWQ